MKVAIMQPYFFPYLGYFQLINHVDTFIFYDDVNYIKKGWINRNKILHKEESELITIPLSRASQNKKINEIKLFNKDQSQKIFTDKLRQNYKNAPYFKNTLDIISEVFSKDHDTISDLSSQSIKTISQFLSIDTEFKLSSEEYSSTKDFKKAKRLIEITKLNNSVNYINPIGGMEIYEKEYFIKYGIHLSFMKNSIEPYKQFNNKPITGLSIIDVLMFNSPSDINEMLQQFELI